MYICHFCHTNTSEAFVGSKNQAKVYSCFTCFIKTLKPFEFDGELVYYPLFGIRDIQAKDSVAYYDKEGNEIARVFLKSYEEGFLCFLKETILEETNLTPEDIKLVIEPFDILLKE
ncbi:hypothetical protein AB3N04_06160 [Alkalihalophilus sp. As8PL]|uniref:Uncharacterized protein n=1 Tax=Alkalihalophilus sp. As8PL TaxID=3237103 RepID=A0AB39BX48_9BACI